MEEFIMVDNEIYIRVSNVIFFRKKNSGCFEITTNHGVYTLTEAIIPRRYRIFQKIFEEDRTFN